MPTTTCPRCNGLGTVCARCSKPRTRRKPGDFGRVCCHGARIVRCHQHVQTVHKCDVCDGVMQSRGTSLEFNVEPMNRVIACSSCLQEWRDRKAVAFDEWLQKTRPQYAHAIHVRVAEQLDKVVQFIRRSSSTPFVQSLARSIEEQQHLIYPVAGRLEPQEGTAPRIVDPRTITTGPTITLHFGEARDREAVQSLLDEAVHARWRDDDPH